MNAKVDTIEYSDAPLRALAAAGVAATSAGVAAVWYFDPMTTRFFPLCPLYSLTGFACPGCGLTRGFHALFHGDVLTALDYNALIPFFGAFLGFLFLSMVLVAVRGRRLTLGKFNGSLLWTFLALLLVFGIVRNLPYYPFNILFP